MIYEPAEDSFLLRKHVYFTGKKVLDMGTGSGILSIEALNRGNEVTAVDINPEAIETLQPYSDRMKIIQSDLFENVKGKFDVILFNAPYLPTEGEDVIWDGGPDGRRVIETFSKQFSDHLNEGGRVLMLISSLTGIEETLALFENFETRILEKQKIPWEELALIEIIKRETSPRK